MLHRLSPIIHHSLLEPMYTVWISNIVPSNLSTNCSAIAYENGASALLLHLSGTLPVTFRGTTYRFPIALWVPHGYPQEAPLVYVTPTEGMAVRPGQHVDPQGKIYHPYLVGWAEFWDVSDKIFINVNHLTCEIHAHTFDYLEIQPPRFLSHIARHIC